MVSNANNRKKNDWPQGRYETGLDVPFKMAVNNDEISALPEYYVGGGCDYRRLKKIGIPPSCNKPICLSILDIIGKEAGKRPTRLLLFLMITSPNNSTKVKRKAMRRHIDQNSKVFYDNELVSERKIN